MNVQLKGMVPDLITQRCVIALCWLPIFLAALLFAYSLFFSTTVDWDIDAFLYLGSRLEHGELLYVKDFETKLPFVQYIFFLPSLLGGIGAWRLINFFIVISLSIPASYFLALKYLHQFRPYFLSSKLLTVFLAGSFLLLLYTLPGSEHADIEMAAASAAYLSFVMILPMLDKSKLHMAFLSGISIAIAALLRPNYFFVFLFFALYIPLANTNLYSLSLRAVIALCFVSGFLCFVALSFVPYVFIENGPVLLAQGLKSLTQPVSQHIPGDMKLLKILSEQFGETLYFYLSLYGGCIAILLAFIFWRSDKENIILLKGYGVPAFASVLCLNISLIQTHYYVHNSIMFAPYLIVIALTVLTLLSRAYMGALLNKSILTTTTIKLVIIAFIFSITALPLYTLATTLARVGVADFNSRINCHGIDNELLSFLKWWKKTSKTFLAADGATYHRLLDESRIGDGHPAMLGEVLKGRRIGPVGDIYMYSEDAYRMPCSVLFTSGKDLIITNKDSTLDLLIKECFSKDQDVYDKVEIPGLNKYNFFRRRS